jgi:hypothetical protein
MRSWAAAHHKDTGDSSAGSVGPVPAGFASPTPVIYSSNYKHGSYFSIGACDSGGLWFDECSDGVGPEFLRHENAGERHAHDRRNFAGALIPYPGTSRARRGCPCW